MRKISKAIFPVAGLGTRFLPATKAMPKEMLPIVNKPLIQYAVEEALDSGIEEIIFVTGKNKTAIEDHFDKNIELEFLLKQKKHYNLIDDITFSSLVPGSIVYLRQQQALGLGHAVWCARHLIHNEPFAVILADDLIISEQPCLKQMIDAYEKVNKSVVSIMNVDPKEIDKYGIVISKQQNQKLFEMDNVFEKPKVGSIDSNLAIVGRYILDSSIFEILEKLQPGADNEIQLTDAIAHLIHSQGCYGFCYEGERIDCGSKIGYIKANIRVGLNDKTISSEISEYINNIVKDGIE